MREMSGDWVKPVVLELPNGRARLEPMRAEHAAGLLGAGRDPAVWRWLPVKHPDSLAAISVWLEQALAAAKKRTEFPFVIIDRAQNCVAGSTRYLTIEPEHLGIEIGWTWIGTPWQRTSINTECKYLLLRHAFEVLKANRVQLKTDERNLKSQAAIRRIGAKFEGVLRQCRIMHDGFRRSSAYFSVLAEEWPAVSAELQRRLQAG